MPWSDDFEQSVRRKAKLELRKSMQRIRNTLPTSVHASSSELIRVQLRNADFYKNKKSIALYSPILHKNEVDTLGIHEDAQRQGLRIAYPYLEEDPSLLSVEERHPLNKKMRFRWVDVESLQLHQALIEQGHGFAEPLSSFPHVNESELDLVLVPGLAFDPYGFRIGYGAGYYDRSLPLCTHATKIGVCFDFQLIIELGRADNDVPVDWIVTNKKILQAIPL